MVIGGSVFASGTQLHLETERQTDKVKYVVSIFVCRSIQKLGCQLVFSIMNGKIAVPRGR